MTVNWEGVIQATNVTSAFLKSLPDGTRAKLIESFKILGDRNLEPADKVAKIDEFIKDIQDEKVKVCIPLRQDIIELQEFLHKTAEKAAAVAKWTKDRLAQEEPEVREGARSFVRLLICPEFVQASDADKETKLNALVAGFNDTQLNAFKKFKAEADVS